LPSKLATSALLCLAGSFMLVGGIAMISGAAAWIVAGLLLLGTGLLVGRKA
jgi:glucose dehydrogenase